MASYHAIEEENEKVRDAFRQLADIFLGELRELSPGHKFLRAV